MNAQFSGAPDTTGYPDPRSKKPFHDFRLELEASHYLLDLALCPEATRLYFALERYPEYGSPYAGPHLAHSVSSGPLIVRARCEETQRWLAERLLKGQALALIADSDLSMPSLVEHFRSLNEIRRPGGEALFRYADPRTWFFLKNSLSPSQHNRLLGPLRRVEGCVAGRFFQVTAMPDVVDPSNVPSILELNQSNLALIQQRRLELLALSIAEGLGLSQKSLLGWFSCFTDWGARTEADLVAACSALGKAGLSDAQASSKQVAAALTRPTQWSGALAILRRVGRDAGAR